MERLRGGDRLKSLIPLQRQIAVKDELRIYWFFSLFSFFAARFSFKVLVGSFLVSFLVSLDLLMVCSLKKKVITLSL